jgi:glycosyltransferase involved in cell wall biosynthesis
VRASDAGALPEVLGDAGTLLPADDPAAWVTAIRSTTADGPDRGAARRERARSFSWTSAAESLLAVWRRLGR